MAVLVTMTVRPPDRDQFEAAAKDEFGKGLPAGCKSQFYGASEAEKGLYIVGGIWDSHDAMHAYSDKIGPDFNARAGTDDVEWETKVFEILG